MILKNNDAIDNGYLFSPDTITSTWGPYEHDVLWPLALGFTEEEIIRPEAEGGFGYADLPGEDGSPLGRERAQEIFANLYWRLEVENRLAAVHIAAREGFLPKSWKSLQEAWGKEKVSEILKMIRETRGRSHEPGA
ncbi:hypothetical protein [uncultured Fretibacterium sp.]|uniref:hypothetical protein n=1 Tax=uncultured Fretibacterium sp. TaxID=1678694 RepID=UPI00261404BD|nr:hypothetical protein [uncultured Fretibacterium sp.]